VNEQMKGFSLFLPAFERAKEQAPPKLTPQAIRPSYQKLGKK
jgi:hypothetical protein